MAAVRRGEYPPPPRLERASSSSSLSSLAEEDEEEFEDELQGPSLGPAVSKSGIPRERASRARKNWRRLARKAHARSGWW